MRKLFAKVTRRESARARSTARRELPTTMSTRCPRPKNFRCEFAFRDRGRLIHAVSRPGVFSHREIDPGARQLMAAMEIAAGDRVLDIGCGSGTVSFAAAFRAEGVEVLAVDSHARAVECTARAQPKRAWQYSSRTQCPRASLRLGRRSTSSWRTRRTMPIFASPASSWKPATRPSALGDASSSLQSGPSGTPSTCRSGSTTLPSRQRRLIGSLAGGAVLITLRRDVVRQAFQPDLIRFTVRLGHHVRVVGLTYATRADFAESRSRCRCSPARQTDFLRTGTTLGP